MTNTYLQSSREFQAITITKTVKGVTSTVTANVQYVLVPKGTPLTNGTPLDAELLNGEVGFYTDLLASGYWEVGVRIFDAPEQPFISCGFIRIK